MKEYDATEIAFKKGYEKAVREIFEEIDKGIIACRQDEYSKEHGFVVRQNYNANMLIRGIDELKKKYTERYNDKS